MISKALEVVSPIFCSDCRVAPVKFGHCRRKIDGVSCQRYKCPRCKKTFSASKFSLFYREKKRHLNPVLLRLLSGGYSQRRAAFDLGINRKTVVRKFIRMGSWAIEYLPQWNQSKPLVETMEFDDMESFEHSKCKPVSITIAVEHKSRRILGFRVSQMPAKGKIAGIARKKYGYREDQRAPARQSLFEEIKGLVSENALIKSDMNPHYGPDVAKHFAGCQHEVTKGRRGCVVGQGELKRGGFDPLFSLNHTCAMLRANINRLFRRTWCTTKLKERLSLHIAIYAVYHNLKLIG